MVFSFSDLDFKIQGFVKPSSDLLELSENMFKQTAYFRINDFIIFMFNIINVSNWGKLKKALKIMKAVGKCTNCNSINGCSITSTGTRLTASVN